MQHYFNQKDIQINTEKGSVVALGKFDGFHQGHKLLLDEVLRLQRDGYTGVVFTFDIRKNSIFDVDKLQSIITSEEKCMLAEQMGIDVLVEYPFDDAFASMEPEAFVTDILVKRLHAGYVVVGTDYGFGKSSPIRTEKITDVNPAVQSAAVDHDALEHGRLLILQIQFAEQEAFSVVNEKTFKADQRQVQQSEKKPASDEAAQAYMFHGKHRVIAEVIKQCAGNGGADQNRQGKMPVIIQSRAQPVNPVYP